MTLPLAQRRVETDPAPAASDSGALRAALAADLLPLGYRDDAALAPIDGLLRRIGPRPEWTIAVWRRVARRLLDAWLRQVVAQTGLTVSVDLATRRAGLLALDVGRQWPDALLSPAPTPGFRAALLAALPIAVPPAAPLAMPAQDLATAPPLVVPRNPHGVAMAPRRLFVWCATAALVAGGSATLARVFAPGGLTTIEYVLIGLFTLNAAWVALCFWSALAGLWVCLRGASRDGLAAPLPPALPLPGRTAILLPTYNEDPQRVCVTIEALYRELDALGALAAFEFFVLSDTTNPDLWIAEETAWDLTRRRLGATGRLFYRRRYLNHARKAGNIEDFCTRWGGRYAHMLILDADSVMSAEAVLHLVRLMSTNADVAVLQTVPRLVNRHTLFARAQQFATAMYGPVLAAGYAWWFGPGSNYWGHNALIRVSAFAAHAGLPVLPGRPPFGGHVLSHDFVEAALLRRAGWRIHLLPALPGSYEESPPTLLDHAARDRRWCQGNLQHAALLGTAGFPLLSRFHLLNGIMAYVASPLWLLFLVTGLAAAVQGRFQLPVYFFPDRTPYPMWHVMDPQLALSLLVATTAVLLVPKACGWLAVAANPVAARGFGGRLRAFASMGVETVYAALSAPVQMLLQTRACWEVLTGRDAGWGVQARDDRGLTWRVCLAHLYLLPVVGSVLAGAAWYVYPGLLGWLLPAVAGMLLAPLLAWLGARPAAGRLARRLGLLTTPEENSPPPVLRRQAAIVPVPVPGAGLSAVLASPAAAWRHFALLSQCPPAELTPWMALARCRAETVDTTTYPSLFPRDLHSATLADRRALELLLRRLGVAVAG